MKRSAYTLDHLGGFYSRIRLPEACRLLTINHLDEPHQLGHLALIIRHMLVHVPFENLSLHYSLNKVINLDPDTLYRKIVGNDIDHDAFKHRGGYCMEVNAFLGNILRTLGYDVYPVGGRVYGTHGLAGWGHMINIVFMGSKTYAIDVGFGAHGPSCPLQLPILTTLPSNSNEPVCGPEQRNCANTSVRLIWDDPTLYEVSTTSGDERRTQNTTVLSTTHVQTHCWIFQSRVDFPEQGDWRATYAFTMQEFLPQDYQVMNHYTSTSRMCFFTYKIICIRAVSADELEDPHSAVASVLRDADPGWRDKYSAYIRSHPEIKSEAGSCRIVGNIVFLARRLDIRVADADYVVFEEFAKEDERIEALRRLLDVRLSSEERKGIIGTVSEIGG